MNHYPKAVLDDCLHSLEPTQFQCWLHGAIELFFHHLNDFQNEPEPAWAQVSEDMNLSIDNVQYLVQNYPEVD